MGKKTRPISDPSLRLFPRKTEQKQLKIEIGVSQNNGTPWYPQIIHFNRVFHYKPSILGYHYFWKHPDGWKRILSSFVSLCSSEEGTSRFSRKQHNFMETAMLYVPLSNINKTPIGWIYPQPNSGNNRK